MSKAQVRAKVRAYLAENRDQREAGDAWIDARFDRFDTDKSGTVDECEWENLLQSLEPHVATMTTAPPWGIDMETNHNKALAVVSVRKRSHADKMGIVPGMVLTSVNGERVVDASAGKKMALSAGVPVRLGFDEPAPKKQLNRQQCRLMVRIQLELEQRDPHVSDEWIDDLFDEFDADRSGFIDDEEWENIALQLASRPYDAPKSARPTVAKHNSASVQRIQRTPTSNRRAAKPTTARFHSPVRMRAEQARFADAMFRLQRQFRAASYSAAGMDISRLFHHYDRDNSGEISFEEFRRAARCDAKITKLEVDDALLRTLFSTVDTDMSGTIGLHEFEQLLRASPGAIEGVAADSPQWLSYSDTRASRMLQSPQRRLGDEYATCSCHTPMRDALLMIVFCSQLL